MKKTITILGLVASAFILNSCAYQDTMDARNREGAILQGELNREIQKGKSLQR